MFKLHSLALLALLGFTSCTHTQVSLDYKPREGAMRMGEPVMAVGNFVNMRREGPFLLGVATTPIGTPVEMLEMRVPVEEAVHNAFLHAIVARGMDAPANSAKYFISGEILELSCRQVSRPYAIARLRVKLVSAANGRVIFTRVFTAERQDAGYYMAQGKVASVLRELASRALQDAVDHAIDDAELRGRMNGESKRRYQHYDLPNRIDIL